MGSILALGLLVLLVRGAWRARGSVFRRTGPLLYPALMMMIAYSLSVGNAGTGFRYRAHLMLPAIGIASILWVASRARVPAVAHVTVPRSRDGVAPGAVRVLPSPGPSPAA